MVVGGVSWSSTQSFAATSICEAEYYGFVRGSAESSGRRAHKRFRLGVEEPCFIRQFCSEGHRCPLGPSPDKAHRGPTPMAPGSSAQEAPRHVQDSRRPHSSGHFDKTAASVGAQGHSGVCQRPTGGVVAVPPLGRRRGGVCMSYVVLHRLHTMHRALLVHACVQQPH